MKNTRVKESSSHALIQKPPFAVVASGPGHGSAEPASEEHIRQAAYALYEARGRADGHDLDDWLRAEAQIAASTSGARLPPH